MFLGLSSRSQGIRGGPALLAGAIFAAGAVAGATFATQAGLRTVRSSGPPTVAAQAAMVPDIGQTDLRSAHPAQVLRVIDGDTFEARVRVWPGLDVTTKVRLRGIDAPELGARCVQEAEKAEAARNALVAILAEGTVGLARVAPDKFGGRVVADASTRRTADVAIALLEAGVARRYAGGRRENWC
jgi:endonuclease YncB( thermonuclease family)